MTTRIYKLTITTALYFITSFACLAFATAPVNSNINLNTKKIAEVELKQSIVGIWSHDLKGSNKSLVMEFHADGMMDIMIYDRFNIESFDVAVGKYYIKDNKINTMFFDASGTTPYFKLYDITEVKVIDISNTELKIQNNGKQITYKLMTQRNQQHFSHDDYI